MLQDYDRPVKGYKTSEMYEHPATVLYDNFAPAEEVFVESAIEEIPNEEVIISEDEMIEDINEIIEEPIIEEVIEEKEGE